MKTRLITTAIAVAALTASAAAAQDQHDDHQKGGGAPHAAGPAGPGPMHGPAVGGPRGPGAPGGVGGMQRGGVGGSGLAPGARPMFGAPRSNGPMGGPVGGQSRTFNAQPQTHMAGPMTGRSTPRTGGSHFAYQGQTHARIHGARFRYPRGYSYRRWSVGQSLPRLLLGAAYVFGAWSDYGIGPPPAGDEWVRYGPDLLLVDIDSGQVVDVIYGVFY